MRYSLMMTKNKVKNSVDTAVSKKEMDQKQASLILKLKQVSNHDWSVKYFTQTKDGKSYMWVLSQTLQEIK